MAKSTKGQRPDTGMLLGNLLDRLQRIERGGMGSNELRDTAAQAFGFLNRLGLELQAGAPLPKAWQPMTATPAPKRKTKPFHRMHCPDCKGRGGFEQERQRDSSSQDGWYYPDDAPCARCKSTGTVVATEAVLLAILKELRRR